MSLLAGIDYSTRFIDIVLLDESTDAASWHRFELSGADAFDRARSVWSWDWVRFRDELENVIAVGIEEPRGYNAGALYRIQGAVLACLPRTLLVQPWLPQSWRKAVGLPGNAPKGDVRKHALDVMWKVDVVTTGPQFSKSDWPQDACDAYCIALATRSALQREERAA